MGFYAERFPGVWRTRKYPTLHTVLYNYTHIFNISDLNNANGELFGHQSSYQKSITRLSLLKKAALT